MKITTRAVYQWNPSTEEYDLVEEQSFDYEGPVAEAKGSSAPSKTTQTTQTKPFNEQLPYVQQVFQGAADLYGQGPYEYYPGQTIAPFGANTVAGQQSFLNLANTLTGQNVADPTTSALLNAYQSSLGRTADTAGLNYWRDQVAQGNLSLQQALTAIQSSPEAQQYQSSGTARQLDPGQLYRAPTPGPGAQTLNTSLSALNGLLATPDPSRDPTVNAFADAVTRPMEQQFSEQILPGISSAAMQSGAFGGSRQDILENQAARDFSTAIGDTRAKVYNNAFSEQLMGQQRALGLMPAVLQAQMMPGQLYNQVGTQQEQLQQDMINADIDRFNFTQNAPYQNLQQFSNLINQFGGSSSMSSMTGPSRNPLMGALGGAATGAGLASALTLPGPGWAYALGGGLLGLF